MERIEQLEEATMSVLTEQKNGIVKKISDIYYTSPWKVVVPWKYIYRCFFKDGIRKGEPPPIPPNIIYNDRNRTIFEVVIKEKSNWAWTDKETGEVYNEWDWIYNEKFTDEEIEEYFGTSKYNYYIEYNETRGVEWDDVGVGLSYQLRTPPIYISDDLLKKYKEIYKKFRQELIGRDEYIKQTESLDKELSKQKTEWVKKITKEGEDFFSFAYATNPE